MDGSDGNSIIPMLDFLSYFARYSTFLMVLTSKYDVINWDISTQNRRNIVSIQISSYIGIEMSNIEHVLYNTIGNEFEKYLGHDDLLTLSKVPKTTREGETTITGYNERI